MGAKIWWVFTRMLTPKKERCKIFLSSVWTPVNYCKIYLVNILWFLLILCVSKYLLLRMRNNCYLFILCFEISYMSQKLHNNMTFFILTISTGWKCIILFENLGVSESIIWILKYIFVMTNHFRSRFLNLSSYEMTRLLGSWKGISVHLIE